MTDYENLCDAYLKLLSLDPNSCVELGLTEKLDQLPDPSLEMVQRVAAMAGALREQASALLPKLTDFYQRLDARLIALSASALELNQ